MDKDGVKRDPTAAEEFGADEEEFTGTKSEDVPPAFDAHIETIRADSIQMTVIDWIWLGHLALGQHTCIAGVQGDGKSQVVYALIAAITTAGCWPGSNEHAPLGICIVLSAEDTDRDVLVPRLKAAGADLTRVHIIKASVHAQGRRDKVLLQRDIKLIEALAKKIGREEGLPVRFISIDPVSSYLGGDLDSHHNTELRDALDPITDMAYATGAAVVSITHFNKAAKGVSALNRIMGGVAFTAAPRAAFAVLRDDEDDKKRLLLPVKLNLASPDEAYGMSFEIEVVDTGVVDDRDPENPKKIIAPRVKWLERVGKTADDVLAAKGDGTSTLGDAMQWLREQLEWGPQLQSDIKREQQDKDMFSWATLRRAAKKLNVVMGKRSQPDGHGPYEWSLPGDLHAKAPEGYTAPERDDEEEMA